MVNVAVAFLLSPIVLRALGNSNYGLWELIMSVVGYMGLLDLGISSAMVRYVAVADGSGKREDMAKIMATSLVFFGAMGVAACAVFVFLGLFPGVLVGKEALQNVDVKSVFLLFAADALFLFPMQVFLAILLGIQCHFFINCSRILLIIVKSAAIYWYILSNRGQLLVFISIVELIYTVISFFIFYVFLISKKEVPRFSFRAVSKKTFNDLFVFGLKNMIAMAASRLQNQSVPLIISYIVGMSSIVYYTFPNRLVDYAKGFSLAIGYPLAPYFSAMAGEEKSEELRKAWLQTTFALQAIMFIMPVVMWQYGEVFLRLWIGLEYAEAGRWVIKLLVIGLIADTLAVNSYQLLAAKASHGRCALIWLMLAVLSIPAGVLGGKLWGVEGVALAVMLVTVGGNMATMVLACASLKITLWEHFRVTYMKLVAPAVISISCSALLMQCYTITNFLDLLLDTTIVCVIYCLLVWLFSFNATMKAAVLKKVSSWVMGSN